MVDIGVAVREYLLTKSAITDIVGQRIYCDQMPEGGTVPAIELTIVSDVPEMELSDLAGPTLARVQLACISNKRTTSRALVNAIRVCGIAAIKGTFSSVNIRGVEIAESFDTTIAATDGSDQQRYQVAQDLRVSYLIGA